MYSEKDKPQSQNISLILSEKCNLDCSYCYVDKTTEEMDMKTARNTIDFVLNQPIKLENINFEFLGGEPLLSIDLINYITEYILRKEYQYTHAWRNKTTFSFTTNGTLLNEKIKDYFLQDANLKSVTLSIDGIKEIHDLNRPNSFDKIMENFNWWKNNISNLSTKSTLNHESLPYLFESFKFLMNDLKIENIFMNPVFEDVWKDNDDKIFLSQLLKIADFLLEDNNYQKCNISLFNEKFINGNVSIEQRCGAGLSMIAVDSKGDIYPCIRFKTTKKVEPYKIGNISTKIYNNKILAFKFSHIYEDNDCKECKLRNVCNRCLGCEYNETGKLFVRTKYACKMYKALYEANEYFFNKLKGE